MTKINQNSPGFSVVETVIIIVIIAVIGLGGWVVYNKHQNSTKKATVTNSKPAQEYFTVTEWKVRAPYTATDRFTYRLTNNDNTLLAISKQLSATDQGCSDFGGGIIYRQVGTDSANIGGDGAVPTVAQYAAASPTMYAKIGSYYYSFAHDQARCGSISADAQNQANLELKGLVAHLQGTN